MGPRGKERENSNFWEKVGFLENFLRRFVFVIGDKSVRRRQNTTKTVKLPWGHTTRLWLVSVITKIGFYEIPLCTLVGSCSFCHTSPCYIYLSCYIYLVNTHWADCSLTCYYVTPVIKVNYRVYYAGCSVPGQQIFRRTNIGIDDHFGEENLWGFQVNVRRHVQSLGLWWSTKTVPRRAE